MILLTRDQFREKTLERDEHKCVICKSEAKDVHHIIERKLFLDGGYYINNAVSLCSECHILAEKTDVSCEELREYANIKEIVLPEDYDTNEKYDKWGNILLEGNIRLPGEMFDTEQFQKILGQEKIDRLFPVKIKCKKYPRTEHFSHSPGATNDDKMWKDNKNFEGKYVIATLKMDGENCLHEDTEITTEDGIKTIKWICDNKYSGKCLCYNIDTKEEEWQKIINWFIYEPLDYSKKLEDDWYLIETDAGNLQITGNQYVWLPNLHCYRRVKDLTEDDEFLLKK